jgi:hypothetical protein
VDTAGDLSFFPNILRNASRMLPGRFLEAWKALMAASGMESLVLERGCEDAGPEESAGSAARREERLCRSGWPWRAYSCSGTGDGAPCDAAATDRWSSSRLLLTRVGRLSLLLGNGEVDDVHTGDGPEFSRGTGSLILMAPLRRAAAVDVRCCLGRSSRDGRRLCVTMVEGVKMRWI